MTRYIKRGYVNNPLWKAPATPEHKPCGYWYNNDTIYGGKVETVTITQGTAWELVAPSLHSPGVPAKSASIAIYGGDIYCLYGADLYVWNGIDDWTLVLAGGTTSDFDYEPDMIFHNGFFYRLAQDTSSNLRNLYSLAPGAPAWNLLHSFANVTHVRFLGVYNNQLYVTSAQYGRLYRPDGVLLKSTNVWPHGVSIIKGSESLGRFLMGSFGAFSNAPLFEYIDPNVPFVNHGHPWSGCRTSRASSWVMCNGKVYYHASTTLGSPFRTWCWTFEDGWNEIATIRSTTYAALFNWDGVLYAVTLSSPGATTDINALMVYHEDTDTWERLTYNLDTFSGPTRKGNIVAHKTDNARTIYACLSDGMLIRFVQTVHRHVKVFDAVGFTSPDDSVWPLPNFSFKKGYINNPRWKEPATQEHKPCGYWYNNRTLYDSYEKESITEGFGWEVVASGHVYPGGGGSHGLAEYKGELYSVMYGRLYIWDRVGAWVLVVDAYDDMMTSAGMVVIGDAIYTGVYKVSPARAAVLRWRLGETTWTEISFITSISGRSPIGIVEVAGQIRMGTTVNASIIDQSFNIVATLNQWTTPIHPIIYKGQLMAICWTTSHSGLYSVVGSSLVKVGEPASVNRSWQRGGYAIYDGVLYITWHGLWDTALHSWDGTTWGTVGPIQDTSPGALITYQNWVYFMSDATSSPPKGQLYKLDLTDASRTLKADPVYVDGTWAAVRGDSTVVFEDKFYVLCPGMIMLRFGNVRHTETFIIDTLGFDSPDDSVWPMPNFP